MSDQVHIHRAADWFESEFQPIPRAEWETYVAEHHDLALWPDGAVSWTDHPGARAVVLTWEDGRIVVDNLDAPTRIRLARIAAGLQAVLQGDDCEVYASDGDALLDDTPDHIVQAAYDATVTDESDRVWDPARPTSRGEFLRGLLRRE